MNKNKKLFQAVKERSLKKVKEAIKSGADVNAKAEYEVTSLMYASKEGHTDTARLLIERGVD